MKLIEQSFSIIISMQIPSDVGQPLDVMTIFGGQSLNCSDYCRDVWHYTLGERRKNKRIEDFHLAPKKME